MDDTNKKMDKNKSGLIVDSTIQIEVMAAAAGTTDTNFHVQQEENTCAKEANVDAQHNQNKDDVRVESTVQIEGIPSDVRTTDTNSSVKQEKHTKAKQARVDVNAHSLEVAQHNQVAKVDVLFKKTLQNLFSNKVATGGLMTYGILREGILRDGEKVLHDYTAPSLAYKKKLFFSSGYQDVHSFKSLDGEDITSYAVIAQDVDNECITADVVDGGIGMKHIKIQVTSHKEGPWKYRVVICGKEA